VGVIDNIFISDDVDGYLGVGPELMEIIPDCNILLYELTP
jgi:hypothetical protein